MSSILVQYARRAQAESPAVGRALRQAQRAYQLVRFSTEAAWPAIARAAPRKITMAVTAHCNLRCTGCRYGRDFMPGAQMPLAMAEGVVRDAKAAGIDTLRLYGGEPLLHRDLPQMVACSVAAGLATYVTTNGTLLDQKIDALHEAGLRSITVGYYGTGARYDAYVQRPGRFDRLHRGLEAVRRRYGDEFDLQLNYLLMRPSASVQAVDEAWTLARRFDMAMRVDLVHYSLPYFTEGPERALQFRPEDEPAIRAVTARLLALKQSDPQRLRESPAGLASIPDWLLRGPAMRVPCDASKLLWIGADGTVQMCYAAFPLGNLNDAPLSSLLFTDTHHAAARGAITQDCPNCHCERDDRVSKHLPSRLAYGRAAREIVAAAGPAAA